MMLADLTAFVCLVFGYFFYWTIHENFPPDPSAGPGVFWPFLGGGLLVGAWALTVLSRKWIARDSGGLFYAALGSAVVLAVAAGAALLAGPWVTKLDPKAHVYGATVWILLIWVVLHAGFGIIMQIYCLARRAAGLLSREHQIDIHNVTLYWHFVVLMGVIAVLVVAGFPLVK
jgi:cytochrome c oxidase subunit I+III